ncbi:MAG: hypothetical protein LBS93_06335, partial [Synergistaceae bacterium]|nr:hypothetical protein [Synergistaceae bacterium]
MTAKRVSRSKSGRRGGREESQGKFKASSVEKLGAPKLPGEPDSGRAFRERPKLDAESIRERVDRALLVAAWLVMVADVFLTASVFTSWMGLLGEAAGGWLVSAYGSGAIIVLFFTAYISISKISGKKIPNPLRQTAGTLLLYFCAALLLGLVDLAFHAGEVIGLLSSGALGRDLASWSFTNLGPLGTTLLGLSLIALAMHCFGITAPFEAIKAAVANFKRGRGRPHSKHQFLPDDESAAEPNEDDAAYDDYDADGSDDGMEAEAGYLEGIGSDEDADENRADDANDEEKNDADEYLDDGYGKDGLASPVEVVSVDEMDLDGEIYAQAGRFPPPVEIFGRDVDDDDVITEEAARPWGNRIIGSLAEFGVEAELAEILLGPTVVQFRIQPSPGVKVRRISDLQNDLAMALAVSSLRVEAPIPGKPYVGIEIPNPKRRGITLRSVIEEDEYQNTTKTLPLPMGMTINGEPLVVGLEELPHLLVAGTTGSGKSVFVNSCIVGL